VRALRLRPQPWKPADAARIFNDMASDLDMDIKVTDHAQERMDERNLDLGDALYVLSRGTVHDDAEYDRKHRSFVYLIIGKSPNSGPRFVRCVVAPARDPKLCRITLISIMWRDEPKERR
jgi:hypothetical protein